MWIVFTIESWVQSCLLFKFLPNLDRNQLTDLQVYLNNLFLSEKIFSLNKSKVTYWDTVKLG